MRPSASEASDEWGLCNHRKRLALACDPHSHRAALPGGAQSHRSSGPHSVRSRRGTLPLAGVCDFRSPRSPLALDPELALMATLSCAEALLSEANDLRTLEAAQRIPSPSGANPVATRGGHLHALAGTPTLPPPSRVYIKLRSLGPWCRSRLDRSPCRFRRKGVALGAKASCPRTSRLR